VTAPLLIPIADIGIVKGLVGPSRGKLAEPCLFCGRWILDPRKKDVRYVEITTYGSVVWAPDGPAAPVPDSQGCFPVGLDCFRQFKMIAEARLRQQALRVVR